MQINGPSQVHGAHGINAPHFTQRTPGSQATPAAGATDRVDISPAAEAAAKAAEAGGVRTDLVNSIRSQIAAGTYDTPDKMDIAMEPPARPDRLEVFVARRDRRLGADATTWPRLSADACKCALQQCSVELPLLVVSSHRRLESISVERHWA